MPTTCYEVRTEDKVHIGQVFIADDSPGVPGFKLATIVQICRNENPQLGMVELRLCNPFSNAFGLDIDDNIIIMTLMHNIGMTGNAILVDCIMRPQN